MISIEYYQYTQYPVSFSSGLFLYSCRQWKNKISSVEEELSTVLEKNKKIFILISVGNVYLDVFCHLLVYLGKKARHLREPNPYRNVVWLIINLIVLTLP